MSAYAALHARIFSRLAVLGSGMAVGAIGFATCIGYITGKVMLYQWDPSLIGMSPNSGLGFLMTGIAIAILGCSDRVWQNAVDT